MIVTSDADRAERLRVLRAHGSKPKYHHKVVGGNFSWCFASRDRFRETSTFGQLDSWPSTNAGIYDRLFVDAGLASGTRGTERYTSESGGEPAHLQSVRHSSFAKRCPADLLEKPRYRTEVYYPVPMHIQECLHIWTQDG